MARLNRKSDEKNIRELDAAWGDACDAHDAKGIAAFYAEDGTCVWPDQKAIYGRPAILRAWKILCKDPGLRLRFDPKRITISDSGDLATDFGVVKGQFGTGKSQLRVTFKYLVVWKKVRGVWKVFFDTYNYNKPLPGAPGDGG